MSEVKKCVVVCRNCHAKIHWNENNKKGDLWSPFLLEKDMELDDKIKEKEEKLILLLRQHFALLIKQKIRDDEDHSDWEHKPLDYSYPAHPVQIAERARGALIRFTNRVNLLPLEEEGK